MSQLSLYLQLNKMESNHRDAIFMVKGQLLSKWEGMQGRKSSSLLRVIQAVLAPVAFPPDHSSIPRMSPIAPLAISVLQSDPLKF